MYNYMIEVTEPYAGTVYQLYYQHERFYDKEELAFRVGKSIKKLIEQDDELDYNICLYTLIQNTDDIMQSDYGFIPLPFKTCLEVPNVALSFLTEDNCSDEMEVLKNAANFDEDKKILIFNKKLREARKLIDNIQRMGVDDIEGSISALNHILEE